MSRRRLLAGIAAATTLALTGCTTGSTTDGGQTRAADTASGGGNTAFPVTIRHAFGETTIAKEPKRVATLGWSDQDNALALGVDPVGATKLTWGGNKAGSSDWFDAELRSTGMKAPVRYDDSDGPPAEEIAKLRPDVVLATNSGLTRAQYDKLSRIAPVVAYPEAAWVTPWRTSLKLVGKALGRSEAAEQVTASTEQRIKDARAKYPQLRGKSLIFAYLATTDLSQVGIYAPQDPRVSFMHDLGLVDAPSVARAIKPGQFYGTVSAERAPELWSDVLLTWSENPGDLGTFTEHKLIGKIPAIADGRAYAEPDKHVSLAVTNPTPLSIPYVIEHFVPHVAHAVDRS
ncbi:iron-siderophore ABC transporter substrate-binding protein [Actinopolymorpha singaporensis]|uniref:Iron complex transport system substrate-binding protein n=1 Tax=Actinopolymorpha singaporensis TaxID=117157 RepID=A0A1H1P4I2_9ACTN|nr:iron-siderophore ABC transporter substrate-binding protein [Actinopolymorpha singaporensis]SDS06097.1 iron complex transport system substrate-binding protein [Actinopolymorpha singaporensis]